MRRMFQLTKGSVSKGSYIATNENFTLKDNGYWYYDGRNLVINADLILKEGQTWTQINRELLATSEIPETILNRINTVPGPSNKVYVSQETATILSEQNDLLTHIFSIERVGNKLCIFNKTSISSSVASPRHFLFRFIFPAL